MSIIYSKVSKILRSLGYSSFSLSVKRVSVLSYEVVCCVLFSTKQFKIELQENFDDGHLYNQIKGCIGQCEIELESVNLQVSL
jgi:hypothetical protein